MSSRARRGRQIEQKRSSRLMVYILLGLAAVAGLLLLLAALNPGGDTAATSPITRTLTAQTGTTPEGFAYKGSPEAPVKVIEYADFQCPACASFFQELEDDLDKQYIETGQVQLIFHEFPLPQHPNAVKTGEAARCAGVQGKFWPMHDLLFSRQREWANDRDIAPRLNGYAGELGLDADAFGTCLASGQFTRAVTAAGEAAQAAGMSFTPSFVVDGQTLDANAVMSAISAAVSATGQ